jgi:hypothetical protein
MSLVGAKPHPSSSGAGARRVQKWIGIAFVAALTAGSLAQADAQALPAATWPVQLSVFAAAAERGTGIGGAQNTDVSAGVDVGFLPGHTYAPSIEVRGAWPVRKGSAVSEEEVLAGVRLERPVGAVRVYADVLGGHMQIKYLGSGMQQPGLDVFYTRSNANVLAAGGGMESTLNEHWSLRLDVQAEGCSTPVTSSGRAVGVVAMVGFGYHIAAGR